MSACGSCFARQDEASSEGNPRAQASGSNPNGGSVIRCFNRVESCTVVDTALHMHMHMHATAATVLVNRPSERRDAYEME
jgi:hypothetical protein